MSEEIAKQVFRHPAYLAHVLDGEIVRICKAEGDIYIGEPSKDKGIEIETGKILMNPDRLSIDCLTPNEEPILMTSDEFKSDTTLITRAIRTLTYADKYPERILSKSTGREVYEEWIEIAAKNKAESEA